MKTKHSLAVAVATAVVALGLSGCAGNQVVELRSAAQAPAAGKQVMRPTPYYGNLGGYRFRKFEVVTLPAS